MTTSAASATTSRGRSSKCVRAPVSALVYVVCWRMRDACINQPLTHLHPTFNRIHAAEEERLSGGIYRALQSAGRPPAVLLSTAGFSNQPLPMPSLPPPSSAGAMGEGAMPSIDVALMAFRCVVVRTTWFISVHVSWYQLRLFILSIRAQGLPLLAGAGPRALRPGHDRRGAAHTTFIVDCLAGPSETYPYYNQRSIHPLNASHMAMADPAAPAGAPGAAAPAARAH